MQITQINGTHLELTDAIKVYVEKRLFRLEKFLQDIEPCSVTADVGKTTASQQKGRIFRAEFNLVMPGTSLRAEETEEDLYAAIDKASDSLARQIKSYKEKVK